MQILKLPAVLQKTGLSRSTVYAKLASGEFPPSVKLGARSVGWVESDIENWLLEMIEATPQTKSFSI